MITIYIYIYIYIYDGVRQHNKLKNYHQVNCISQCIKNQHVPKGVELTFEPTIGNLDQEFIDNWYSSLKESSCIFCDKTIKEANDKLDQTDSILKGKLEKAEFEEVEKTIVSNETATKKILCQCKFKNYNKLKYKPKLVVKAANITDENENLKKATYAEILLATKIPTRGFSINQQ